MRNSYVYEHVDPRTGAVFYVGMGEFERAWHYSRRKPEHRAVLDAILAAGHQYGSWVRMVATGLSEREARDLEAMRITERLGEKCQLVNRRLPGERLHTPGSHSYARQFRSGKPCPAGRATEA